jgi:hypothetical protein
MLVWIILNIKIIQSITIIIHPEWCKVWQGVMQEKMLRNILGSNFIRNEILKKV